MSSARGQANQCLYLARILLAAWARDGEAARVPVQVLHQAYFSAVREHLITAYGWFLLELSGLGERPEAPPRSCADLPAPAPGKAEPGEIREFRQLEDSGWLGSLLSPSIPYDTGMPRSRDNLAAPAPELPGRSEAVAWADKLAQLFERMSESLDEY